MDLPIDAVIRMLKAAPGKPKTVQEWIAQTNLCILYALKTIPAGQYGLLRYHVRRAAELFRIALIIHERRREGADDVEIQLEDLDDYRDPPSWTDWFRRIQFDLLGNPHHSPKGGSTQMLEDTIAHLERIYQDLNKSQSDLEGLMTCVYNYI